MRGSWARCALRRSLAHTQPAAFMPVARDPPRRLPIWYDGRVDSQVTIIGAGPPDWRSAESRSAAE